MRPESALAAGQWDIPCPVCGGPLEPSVTPERVSNPQNAYGMSKLGEEMVAVNLGRRYGIPTMALRYSIVQGPRQSVYNAYSGACRIFCLSYLLGQAPTLYEDGGNIRNYVNIDDVVDANVLVLTDERAVGPGVQRRRRQAGHHAGVRRGRAAPVRLRPGARGDRRVPVRRHPAHTVRHRRAAGAGLGAAAHPGQLGRGVRRMAQGPGRPGRGAGRGQRQDARAGRGAPVGKGVGRVKAFLLAAGVGSRLRPITDTIPKCMVAIGGQPMLDIWLDAFDQAGVDEVLVNLHHLPEVVIDHVAERTGAACRPDRRSSPTCWAAPARCAPTGTGWPGRRCSWPATPTT